MDFFVIGAMKSGTSWLHDQLNGHPEAFVPALKEPNYYAFQARGGRDFAGPFDRTVNRVSARDRADYASLFRGASGKLRGDCSTLYLHVPGSAAQIAAERPDARVIVLLREPVSRSISAWRHLRRDEREPQETFEGGLRCEAERVAADWEPIWHYEGASRYSWMLDEWLAAFPREQVMVTAFERVVRDTDALLDETARFLDISPAGWSPATRRQSNASGMPRNGRIYRALKAETRWKIALKDSMPTGLARRFAVLRDRTMMTPPQDDAGSSAGELRRRLAPEVAAVADRVGADVTAWWSRAPTREPSE